MPDYTPEHLLELAKRYEIVARWLNTWMVGRIDWDQMLYELALHLDGELFPLPDVETLPDIQQNSLIPKDFLLRGQDGNRDRLQDQADLIQAISQGCQLLEALMQYKMAQLTAEPPPVIVQQPPDE